MPRHQQVTTCRKTGGPVSKHCACEHCALSVCSVCGGGEGSLTTDCPGTKVDADRHQELCETSLDYTDARGWHLMEPGRHRSARFEHTAVPPETPRADPRAVAAPGVDWRRVDRSAALQHELTLKAVAWVMADETCEEHLAAITRTREAVTSTKEPARMQELLGQLERENVDFQLSSRRAEAADDEFRQAARRIVSALREP